VASHIKKPRNITNNSCVANSLCQNNQILFLPHSKTRKNLSQGHQVHKAAKYSLWLDTKGIKDTKISVEALPAGRNFNEGRKR
jgi:hypothetical protein